jgi:hypothetical protein
MSAACKFCGSDKGFREVGFARCEASRTSYSVAREAGGKVKVSWDPVDVDDFDSDFEPDGVACRECGREEARIEDLVGAPVNLEPGARVVCPDGLRATVATVDATACRLTVEGWHEEFAFSEVTAVAA